MLGVVQTGHGVPIYHEVFAGNTAESPTLLPTLRTVLERFPSIRRVVLVPDRGLLSRVQQFTSKNTRFSPHAPSVSAGFRPDF